MSGISVIMPARNAAAWIDEALASVLAQGDCVAEIIVVDDASTDDTAARVLALAQRDARVRLLSNATQTGTSIARNRALDAAGGEWIALVDADDLLAPQRFLRMLAVAENCNADAVADNLAYFGDGVATAARTLFPVRAVPADGFRLTTTLFLQHSHPGRADGLGLLQPIIRREFLRQHGMRFREVARTGEDFLLFLEMLLAGARFQVIPAALYRYRVHPASTMAAERAESRIDAQLQVQEELAATAAARGELAVAAALRSRCDWLQQVQRPLLQLRSRYLHGERLALLPELLKRPRLWWPFAVRISDWLRRRARAAIFRGAAPVR